MNNRRTLRNCCSFHYLRISTRLRPTRWLKGSKRSECNNNNNWRRNGLGREDLMITSLSLIKLFFKSVSPAMQTVTPRWRYDQIAAFLSPHPHPHPLLLAAVNAEPLMALASSSSSLKNVCLPPPSPYLSNNETTQLSVSIHNGAALEPSWPAYRSRGAVVVQQQRPNWGMN